VLIAAIAAYDPLQILAINVPGSISLITLGLYWLVVFGGGILLLRFGRRLGLESNAAAISVGVLLLLVLKWEAASGLGAAQPVVLLLPALCVLLFRRIRNARFAGGLIGVLIVVFAIAPAVELSYVRLRTPEPILRSFEDLEGPTPSPLVEDVVVVVFDELPSPRSMSRDLSIDPGALLAGLRSEGFVVPPAGVSTATATFASIADVVELDSPLVDGSSVGVAELADLYDRIGGDNRTVEAFRRAGFRYTHLEGGWVGSACRESVDHCVRRPFIDSTIWRLLKSTVVGDSLESVWGHPFTHAALEGTKSLLSVLDQTQTNGEHDYIFAHVMLPHFPYRLTEECEPVEPEKVDVLSSRVSQVQCANRQIAELGRSFEEDTAVLMMSDHGMALGPQLTVDPERWTSEQIDERLGVFLAYRLPEGCGHVREAVTILAMRATVACALSTDPPNAPPVYKVIAQPEGGRPLFPVLGLECLAPLSTEPGRSTSWPVIDWESDCRRVPE
jgi:hypothetical protein